MLVRFLSFAASIIGTRRYRPVLISLAAIVLSVASIAAVASLLGGDPHRAASRTGQKSTQTERQTTAPLDDLDNQTTREEPPQSSPNHVEAPLPSTENSKPAGGSSSSQASLPTPDITLSTSMLMLSSTNPTLAISASTSDKSAVNWSIAADSADTEITATIEQASASTQGAATSVRFRLGSNAKAGTYQFTITAKDAARGLDITKKITVTVNS